MSTEIEPHQQRSRDTRSRILEAADRLMMEKPFEKLSVAEIAKTANVSVGNFYNRFPDKITLLLTMLEEYEQERTDYLNEAYASPRWQEMTQEQRAQELVKLYVDFFWSRKALIRSFVLHHRTHILEAPEPLMNRARDLADVGSRVLAGPNTNRADLDRAYLGLQMVLALCREFILFGDDPSKQKLKLGKKKLVKHLSKVMIDFCGISATTP